MTRLIVLLSVVIISVNSTFAQEASPQREVSKGTVITGVCLFLTPEMICIAVAAIEGNDASYLPIPLVGPFITNAKDTPNSTEGLLVALGLSTAEAIGITLFTVGMIGKKKNTSHVMVYPIIHQNGCGLKLKVNL